MDRLSWPEYFMRIAQMVAERSTCPRVGVGAVIVKDRNILATGYNGAPRGAPHCHDVGCLVYTSTTPDGGAEENCYRVVHAEINAISQAAKNGTPIEGCDVYITHSPCIHCFKVLINVGVRTIYYAEPYKVDALDYFLPHTDVQLVHLPLEG